MAAVKPMSTEDNGALVPVQPSQKPPVKPKKQKSKRSYRRRDMRAE